MCFEGSALQVSAGWTQRCEDGLSLCGGQQRTLQSNRQVDTQTGVSRTSTNNSIPVCLTVRWVCPLSSRGRQQDTEDDDVSRLPDTVGWYL